MSLIKKTALSILGILFFFACEKVEKLSDNASLKSFKVISHEPSAIQLGEPYVNADTIYIPVLRGRSLFPLSIKAEPTGNGDTKQILLGTSFSSFDNIIFQTGDINDKIFYLIAKSGFAKPYYIKLDISDQNEESTFKQFDILGSSAEGVLLPPKAYINEEFQHIAINAINYQLPITIQAEVAISDNANIVRSDIQQSDTKIIDLIFNSLSDTITYKVEAESGIVQDWKIYLNDAKTLTGGESNDIIAAVSVSKYRLNAQPVSSGLSIIDKDINFNNSSITFSITSEGSLNAISIIPEFDLSANSQLIGYIPGDIITFDDLNSSYNFYILDNRTGYFKEWTLYLTQSGVTDITEFAYTYKSGQVTQSGAFEINNVAKTLTLVLPSLHNSAFPITITPQKVVVSNGATTNIGIMTFSNKDEIHTFSVSAGGKDDVWTVILKEEAEFETNADIESFTISSSSFPSLTNGNITINKDNQEVGINLIYTNGVESILPLTIYPIVALSQGATTSDFISGNSIKFENFDDIISWNITAENGQKETWKVKLINKPQLPNADFNAWTNETTIDPIPGAERGWATANNSIVKLYGTKRVGTAPNYQAELTTGLPPLPKNLMAAGTLYLGYFKLNLGALDRPREMTKFGVSFEARPTAVKVYSKYEPGPKLQRSKHISGSGILAKYELEDVTGQDKGQIWIELIHWSSDSKLEYSGEPKEGVYVLARGEYNLDAIGWHEKVIPLEKTTHYNNYTPTHIVVVMSSSAQGHLFLGAIDSKLTVDNIELIY